MQELNRDLLANRIKEARIERGLLQYQLTNRAMLSSTETVSNLENGKSGICCSVITLYNIAVALGVSLDWLCGLTDDKPKLERFTATPVNHDVRQYMQKNGIRQRMIATKWNRSVPYISSLLNKQLDPNVREQFYNTIDEIVKENDKKCQ